MTNSQTRMLGAMEVRSLIQLSQVRLTAENNPVKWVGVLLAVLLVVAVVSCTQTKYVEREVAITSTPPLSTYTEAQVIGIARNWPLAQREEINSRFYDNLDRFLNALVTDTCKNDRSVPDVEKGEIKATWTAFVAPEKRWEVNAVYSGCAQHQLKGSWLFLEDGPRLLPVSGMASFARLRSAP